MGLFGSAMSYAKIVMNNNLEIRLRSIFLNSLIDDNKTRFLNFFLKKHPFLNSVEKLANSLDQNRCCRKFGLVCVLFPRHFQQISSERLIPVFRRALDSIKCYHCTKISDVLGLSKVKPFQV